MKYELPKLPYSYDALEPYIDARTMEVHYSKHHQGYADKTDAVLKKYPDLYGKPVEDLIRDIDSLDIDDNDKISLRNNGGGYINHNLFWNVLGPQKEIDEQLKQDIEKSFGSLDKFKEEFSACALSHFGSGWAWLARDGDDNLQIYSLPNQDSPYSKGHIPILNLDVWEHAYYLKYQNRRAEYIENWWNVLKLL